MCDRLESGEALSHWLLKVYQGSHFADDGTPEPSSMFRKALPVREIFEVFGVYLSRFRLPDAGVVCCRLGY